MNTCVIPPKSSMASGLAITANFLGNNTFLANADLTVLCSPTPFLIIKLFNGI